MTTSSFTIALTPASPTALKLEPGRDGQLTFTVTCLATPDQVFDVILQALLVVGKDGKTQEADWLIVSPQQALIAGGKTETVTITVQPTATSPRGKHAIELAISLKTHASDLYAQSPTVTCEVIDPQPPKLPDPPKPPDPPRPSLWQRRQWPTLVNLVLGIWLFFSVFTLSATGATGSQLHSLFVAVTIVGASIITVFAPRARRVTLGLAVWLLVTQLLFQDHWTGEKINNVIIALALITASIVSQLVGPRRKPAPQQPPDPPLPRPPPWLIPVVVIGGIVVLGASTVHLITRKPSHTYLGLPCSNIPCDTGLVCMAGACRLLDRAGCKANVDCASGQCVKSICAISIDR